MASIYLLSSKALYQLQSHSEDQGFNMRMGGSHSVRNGCVCEVLGLLYEAFLVKFLVFMEVLYADVSASDIS